MRDSRLPSMEDAGQAAGGFWGEVCASASFGDDEERAVCVAAHLVDGSTEEATGEAGESAGAVRAHDDEIGFVFGGGREDVLGGRAEGDVELRVLGGVSHAADVVLDPVAEALLGHDAVGGESFFGIGFDVEDAELRFIVVRHARRTMEGHDGDGGHIRGVEDSRVGFRRGFVTAGDARAEDENGMMGLAEDFLGGGSGDPLADVGFGAGGEDENVRAVSVQFFECIAHGGLADDDFGVDITPCTLFDHSVELLAGVCHGFFIGDVEEQQVCAVPAAEGGGVIEGLVEVVAEVGEDCDALERKHTLVCAEHE